jgi:glycerate kinase
LRALGLQLNDESGAPVAFGGAALAHVHSINTDKLDLRLKKCKISVACDVDNPLLGPKGASAVYGPQNGATTSMVTQLDAALEHFANISEATTGLAHRDQAGAGAGGGTGFGLMQYTSAQFQPGIDLVLDRIGFDAHLSDADLVITGEGRLDSQSLSGKAPVGVAKRAKQHDLFVMAIVGSVDIDETLMVEAGIDACFSIMPGVSDLPKAIKNAVFNLDQCAYNVGKLINLNK